MDYIKSIKHTLREFSVLFPGDRVLTINHQPISDLHLSSVNQLIEKTEQDVLLEVQYQVEIGCKYYILFAPAFGTIVVCKLKF